ncbi:hypothetical protein A0J61_02089 [Choanephora cucurbitarum]|uniref:Uncharacterized protein n=1 Tax=Choanephora cucurbitarum TaxID=101091 RepID=A0A1C7NL56_9FUNG|nr:hypothetical protein A0J61_02089 [Choanephora cucurbitarum]
MDLYFHASPKKRVMFFKKNKTSSVRPTAVIRQKDEAKGVTGLSDFLSNKASYHQMRRLWTQLKFQKQQNDKAFATASFDSQEHTETLPSSVLSPKIGSPLPPTPPPKKSHTMPNLVALTDPEQFRHRALPSLPSVSLEEKLIGTSKTSAWVSESIQRWFSVRSSQSAHHLANAASSAKQSLFGRSEELLTSKSGQILIDSELPNEAEEATQTFLSNSIVPNYAAEKMILQSKILQITHLGSSKSYEYTLDICTTNNDVQTYYGIMRKAAKGLSVCHPRKALSFPVQGRFQVECHLTMKPHTSSSTILSRLRSFRSSSDLSKSSMSKSTLGDSAEEDTEEETIQGKLILDSGEDLLHSFANKGIGRYTLQTSGSEVIELTIAFLLEKASEENEEELQTPIDQDVLRYCSAGDYLTIYVKGEHHPVSK